MHYLTNYYKNLSEQLQERVNHLENLLSEVKITKFVGGKAVKYDPSEKSEKQAEIDAGARLSDDEVENMSNLNPESHNILTKHMEAKKQKQLRDEKRDTQSYEYDSKTGKSVNTYDRKWDEEVAQNRAKK
jgi:hypothetical protein